MTTFFFGMFCGSVAGASFGALIVVMLCAMRDEPAPSPDADDYESDQASRLRELVARN